MYFSSLSFFFLTAAYVYYGYIRRLASMESLSEFEGPNGEGSPIGPLIGMFIETILFVIPWAVAAIRGIRLYASMRMAHPGRRD